VIQRTPEDRRFVTSIAASSGAVVAVSVASIPIRRRA
jgi:hypothetical protein